MTRIVAVSLCLIFATIVAAIVYGFHYTPDQITCAQTYGVDLCR